MAKKRLCEIADCNNVHLAKGLCHKHYYRLKKTGTTKPNPNRARRGAALSFLKLAVAANTDDCIIWPFKTESRGYGRLYYKDQYQLAHRVALTLAKGPPEHLEMQAAHCPVFCNIPACINPKHLRWATAAENSRDKKIAGTQRQGVHVWAAKLSESDVVSIRLDERPHKDIAADYGIQKPSISKIRARKTWKHVA